MCYNEGRLLAYLDGQLSPRESRAVECHLKSCPACRQVLERLDWEREETGRYLAPYHLAASNLPVSEPSSCYNANRTPKGAMTAMIWMRRHYPWIAAAAVVLVLFCYSPARSLASQLLGIFRVEKVQVMHFSPSDLASVAQALETQQSVNIEDFGKIDQKPLPDVTYPAETRLPKTLGGCSLVDSSSQPGTEVSITASVEGINSFLQSMGSNSMLPPELDGKTFKIVVPKFYNASYQREGTALGGFNIFQTAAPQLEVPPGVAMEAVRNALLSIPILPENLKSALQGVEDWTRTLPVPDFDRQAGEVDLNGAPGLFVQGRQRTGQGIRSETNSYYGPSLLAWYRNGVWTILEGPETMTKQDALALAGQLEKSLW